MAGMRGLSWRTWRLRVENCQRSLFTHGFAGQLSSSNPSLWPFHIVPLCGLVLASSWHGNWVQKARRDTLLIMVSLKKVLDHALDAFYSTWWSQSPVSRRGETDSACLWDMVRFQQGEWTHKLCRGHFWKIQSAMVIINVTEKEGG